jgi:ribosome-binding protein aMBF1 (putative translation factor)
MEALSTMVAPAGRIRATLTGMSAGSGPRRRPGWARSEDPKAFAAVVGEAVRRARQSRGWTQAQLAQTAGFSPNYIARLERGELGPSLFVASQLCDALGIDVSSLVHPAGASPRTTRRRVAG